MNSPYIGVQKACRILRTTPAMLPCLMALRALPEPCRDGDRIVGWRRDEIDSVPEWFPSLKECKELLKFNPIMNGARNKRSNRKTNG